MLRTVIHIDQETCTGCGLCVNACHEGALALVDGKARLMRDDFCDGLGDCLPSCPEGAITFIQREAAAYDEAAVIAAKMQSARQAARQGMAFAGCPSTQARSLDADERSQAPSSGQGAPSHLSHWPVQIKLVPTSAPYLKGARLLVAADCTAFSYGAFHEDYIKGRVCLVGCPKLDGVDYTEKLLALIAENDVEDILVARMEVPCCGGLERAVSQAVASCGKPIPVRIDVISAEGRVVESR